MILSQEDNSSPALMSRAFSLLKIPGTSSLIFFRVAEKADYATYSIPRATMFNNPEARGFSGFAQASSLYKPHSYRVSYSGIIYRLTT